jgi:hypothetical protein
MELTLGEEPITTFRQAVERVAALAHARLPQDLHGHLERAQALVRHGHVFPTDDGKHAQVLSSDGTRWYPVNGHCTCMDAPKAPQGLCKHRLAFGLYRRASELLHSQGSPDVPFAVSPFRHLLPVASVPAALPEAPASVNVRVMIEGHEAQVTLRDTDEERLLTRLAALLARYPAAPCGGKGKGEAQRTPPAQAPASAPICPVHGPMKESSKAPGTWFCSKKLFNGSYCQERMPK